MLSSIMCHQKYEAAQLQWLQGRAAKSVHVNIDVINCNLCKYVYKA
jgi:hypothetical protein